MDLEVRAAADGDLAVLPEIERGADGLFRPLGIVFPPGPTVIEELIGTDADIIVAGDPPVGFAAVRDVDGAAYLEQIAVRAGLTGRASACRCWRPSGRARPPPDRRASPC